MLNHCSNTSLVNSGSTTAQRNLKRGFKILKKQGIDPKKSESIIDIGAGRKFGVVTTGKIGTLTASRCSQRAFWLTNVLASVSEAVESSLGFKLDFHVPGEAHRRLTCAELARLQGFESKDIPWRDVATPLTARGAQVGNSMSVPVVQEAIRSVLAAAKLLPS